MSQIRFKPRNGGATVQLVRHVYCPKAKRSRTITVGSLRRDADPDEVLYGIRLAEGQELADADVACIREWLRRHGDQEAAERRAQRLRKLEQTIRERIASEVDGHEEHNVFEHAAEGLARAASALVALANEASLSQGRPRTLLRPSYLKVYRTWLKFATVAKNTGVAKSIKRGQKHRHGDAEMH